MAWGGGSVQTCHTLGGRRRTDLSHSVMGMDGTVTPTHITGPHSSASNTPHIRARPLVSERLGEILLKQVGITARLHRNGLNQTNASGELSRTPGPL